VAIGNSQFTRLVLGVAEGMDLGSATYTALDLGFATASIFAVNSEGATINGLDAQENGYTCIVQNKGSGVLNFGNNATGDANGILTPYGGAILLNPGEAAWLYYSTARSRWIVLYPNISTPI